jgi:phosphatidylserine decarboxylase
VAKPESIRFWDREACVEEIELVLGEGAVRWLYETPVGHKLADWVLSRKLPSVLYGEYQSSAASRHKIQPFIRDFKIPMDDFQPEEYASFNDFFIRKFRPGARPFDTDPTRLAAPAEARYLAFESIRLEQRFPVKGRFLTAEALLGSRAAAEPFEGGPLLLARLCPVDYHRFHFPDDGEIVKFWKIPGRLHSVNPMALRYRGDIFATNERHVSILETRSFGKLAYIEVGALCVGRIIQSWQSGSSGGLETGRGHESRKDFLRGEEKGYFLFGGSTVIILGEPGRWKPDDDLLERSAREQETLVKLGTAVARRLG